MSNKGDLPVYVTWTKGVLNEEAALIVAGMKDMLRFVSWTPKIKVFGSKSWLPKDKPYSSPDWYQQHNLIQLPNKHIQVNGDGIIADLRNEPWRKAEPHIDFMILDMDLNCRIEGKWINFIFGIAAADVGSVQSVFRFRLIKKPEIYSLVLRAIGQHEFGHVLGLISRNGPNVDFRRGLYTKHCLNLCVMRQVNSLSEIINLTLERQNKGIILCSDCQSELKVRKTC